MGEMMEVLLQVLRKIVILVFYGELMIRIFLGTEYQKYVRYGLGVMVLAIALEPALVFLRDGFSADRMMDEQELEKKMEEITIEMEGVAFDWQTK